MKDQNNQVKNMDSIVGNLEDMNFKNTSSFYKFITNSNDVISKESYELAFKKMQIRGTLKHTKKGKEYKNNLYKDHAETKPLFKQKHRRTINIKQQEKCQNIRKLFSKLGFKGDSQQYFDFLQFFENNLKDKYKRTKRYIELFIKAYDSKMETVGKARLDNIFKPFLNSKIVGYSDVIFKYYKNGTKAITKPKGVMSILPKDNNGNVLYEGK